MTHSTNLHSDDPGPWDLIKPLLTLAVWFIVVFVLPIISLTLLLHHLPVK